MLTDRKYKGNPPILKQEIKISTDSHSFFTGGVWEVFNPNQLKMKSGILIFCIAICISDRSSGQSAETTDQVIEGGKLIVELVKALSAKKDTDKDPGCKGKYADLCIENASLNSITVYLAHRVSAEKREVVIL